MKYWKMIPYESKKEKLKQAITNNGYINECDGFSSGWRPP